MSILSDGEIVEALEAGQIVIDPLIELDDHILVNGVASSSFIQPCTIDLHLGPRFGEIQPMPMIDRYGPDPIGPTVTYRTAEKFWLLSGEFIICGTAENITLVDPTLVAVLSGKSTLARDGLHVEAAGLVDPGWLGNLTLEVFNAGPATIILRPGQPICQIHFVRMDQPAVRLYGHHDLGSHYQGATQAEAGYDPSARPTPVVRRRIPPGLRSSRLRNRTSLS